MASILITVEPGSEKLAEVLVQNVQEFLRSAALQPSGANERGDMVETLADRGGVLAPLVHPQTKVISVLVWAHNAVAGRFTEEMQLLFATNAVCIPLRQSVRGLPLAVEPE